MQGAKAYGGGFEGISCKSLPEHTRKIVGSSMRTKEHAGEQKTPVLTMRDGGFRTLRYISER